jgi:hypothetical protein
MWRALYADDMREGDRAAVWPARLRWRLRGALLWPLFALLTVLDAVLLGVLPIAGRGTDFVPALLLAMFFNLLAVAGLGRVAARSLRRRRPDLPRVVADDRAGSFLLAAVTAVLVVAGVIHGPGRAAADRAAAAEREAVRAYVLAHGTSVHRSHLGAMDTVQHGDDFFRTCVPGDPAAGVRPLCLLVDTSKRPPIVRLDHDRTPNRHD